MRFNVRMIGICAAALIALGGCGGGGGGGDAAGGGGSATLQWTAPADSRVVGYRVYFGTTTRTYEQAPGKGIETADSSFTATGLTQGVTYYFAVTSFDASGAESAYSEEATKLVQ